jgi:hypothetical protein
MARGAAGYSSCPREGSEDWDQGWGTIGTPCLREDRRLDSISNRLIPYKWSHTNKEYQSLRGSFLSFDPMLAHAMNDRTNEVS